MMVDTTVTKHLVKEGDLNHHGSLYAGRSADWLIEIAFLTAASALNSNSIVALKINELRYLYPVYGGDIIQYEGRTVLAGQSSLIVYVLAMVKGRKAIEGFVTFVFVDENGNAKPHGLTIEADEADMITLQKRAEKLSYTDR